MIMKINNVLLDLSPPCVGFQSMPALVLVLFLSVIINVYIFRLKKNVHMKYKKEEPNSAVADPPKVITPRYA